MDIQGSGELFVEIESFLGRAGTRERVKKLESALAPMYAALPKNSRGRLEQATVRYALHRFFARHALYVQGLDVAGGSWNASSPMNVLTDKVPSYIEELLEDRLAQDGFGLHEVAVLATALKHLFNTEATKRLEAAYVNQDLSVSDVVGSGKMYDLLDSYMAIYILERNVSNASWVRRAQSNIHKYYPGWKDTQSWVHDTRRNIAFVDRNIANPFASHAFDFSDVFHVVEEVHDQYGVWQDVECQELRDKLLEHEQGATGRVRLADFHGSALKGSWQFSESRAYLRHQGVLDESSPSDPLVVIPNYMYAKSNCVAKSDYYSVCCLNECEFLLEHVERGVQKPEATPQEIAAVVSHIPSSTVPAPRNISQLLLGRLDEVAAIHGGTVPLQSRLFSQFMHHAYPRECPYPHISGTTSHLSTQQWLTQTGKRATATRAELREHSKRATWRLSADDTTTGVSPVENMMPWSLEEELLQPRSSVGSGRGGRFAVVLLLLASLAAAVTLSRALQSAWSAIGQDRMEKCFV